MKELSFWGTENLFLDFYEHPDELGLLLSLMHSHYIDEMEAWSSTDVDALFMMDDWGAQSSLLIDPGLWRKYFRQMYADYAEIARQAGKKIFMHSDGYILQVIEDLTEIGVDALNSRVFCMAGSSFSFQRENHILGKLTVSGFSPTQ